ncbi:type I restriction endonuclease subunit R [Aliarcobacter butzleri]|uniref:type I restriction endonuclease subunit R n=1 Tax=Aliarcobacter butzleri TaxID=28197 RepID=UPI001EDB9440|nr:type I restriction endonuclease subunit R [Aliarcobacter butzleri]MCG3707803.1 type I restriction endonuclease subunit R [Aliarcobacter butzleri]MCT7593802.1 type I restriction endonuclease subunit R [Aliarcobacter butzleri]MCT7598442.1 type I restriction endonuclease subunit R [Aliarcobacter butzleri]MCT7652102.1 type I restriction endonuclease subunit R [Aliarcobacter butzleri]UWY61200.1 type I restriction endonuclease subunit R [Aliarcobacter butzleri]
MSQTPEYLYSELPAIELFKKLGFNYFDASIADTRESINEVILEDRLRQSLLKINPWLRDNTLEKVVRKLKNIQASTLMEANQIVFDFITKKDSITEKPTPKAKPEPVFIIDYENIENNDFLIVNQMKYNGIHKNSIPDIVVYINGLPLAIIEAKSPKVSITDAISDLAYYQENSQKLFYYNQICVGMNKGKALYGTIGSQFEHYSKYKLEDLTELELLVERTPTAQDILIYSLFKKEMLLDIIRNFTIFEIDQGRTIKKLPRYQQLRAVNKIVKRLKTENKGGVVWHTQGSGKSITMVYLATKLRREEAGFDNPTILVVTDRIDLDNQISSTFRRTGFSNPIQAVSISNLKELLKDSYGKTLMTTIHKFQERAQQQKEEIEILSDKSNVFVLIDEAHRSQYGMTAAYMRNSLPNAKFIAFTGTPIDKEEKSTLRTFYGGSDYIDKYTIKQSVEDGNTLAIRYQTGMPEYFIEKDLMNEVFSSVFGHESEEKQAKLKSKAASLDTFLMAKRRVEEIAKHIIKHFKEKIYPNNYKAMLVCHNRYQAIAYQKAFLKLKEQGLNSFESKVIMSFDNKKDPIEFRELAVEEDKIKKVIEEFKLPFGNENEKSLSGEKRFDNTAILIVSDMLLTGYDAPIVQCMYIDKLLKEHTLLQAIARVNRTKSGKEYGLVVDYAGITNYLTEALKIFSGDLEASDVMTDIENEKTILENRHSKMVAFFNDIKIDRFKDRAKFVDECVLYLEPEDLRDKYIDLVKLFNKSMDIVLPDSFATKFEYDLKLYNDIKLEAVNTHTPEKMFITREETKKIQMIIDEHLRATGVNYLLHEAIDITDPEAFRRELENKSGKTKELTIANRIKHTIQANKKENPDFYKDIAKRLEELIKAKEEDRITQAQLLIEFDKLQEEIRNSKEEWKRLGLTSKEQFPIFKTLEKVVPNPKEFTIAVFEKIGMYLQKSDWKDHDDIKKEIRKNIKSLLRNNGVDKELVNSLPITILEILENQ